MDGEGRYCGTRHCFTAHCTLVMIGSSSGWLLELELTQPRIAYRSKCCGVKWVCVRCAFCQMRGGIGQVRLWSGASPMSLLLLWWLCGVRSRQGLYWAFQVEIRHGPSRELLPACIGAGRQVEAIKPVRGASWEWAASCAPATESCMS